LLIVVRSLVFDWWDELLGLYAGSNHSDESNLVRIWY